MSDKEYRDGGEYVIKFHCQDCGNKWTRRYVTDAPYDIKRPACPACKKVRKEREGLKEIIASGKAPSISGTSLQNRALDAAAETVMQDYGLTDLKTPTEIRQGESQAPKIHPALQARADAMFNPKMALAGTAFAPFVGAVARSALGGSYSPKLTNSPDPILAVQAGQRQADLMSRTQVILEEKGQK